MTAFLFPGQGAQHPGMGEGFFSRFPEYVAQADNILGYSIENLCLHEPQQLNQTQFTQPALYTVNSLMYFDRIEQGQSPIAVAGHSMGEYNALLAAKVFDFKTGLELVKKRAELMQQATGGGMAAIIHLDEAAIQDVLQTNSLTSIDIANINAPNQLVLSGPKADIQSAQSIFEEHSAMVIPLNVSGAFHSRYMQTAQEAFAEFLQQYSFNPPQLPVIANVNAKPYQHENIHSHLAQQLTHSVRWSETIQYLSTTGVTEFIEIGPGKVLTGLLRHIPVD